MQQFKLTVVGALAAVAVYIVTFIFDLEIFEWVLSALEEVEHLEVDELIVPFLVFLIFAVLDFMRRDRLDRTNKEKVKIYRAMLSSTHHILNNFLNQMTLFKLQAESTPGFDEEVLALYDAITDDAQKQIQALSSISNIDEFDIHESVKPR